MDAKGVGIALRAGVGGEEVRVRRCRMTIGIISRYLHVVWQRAQGHSLESMGEGEARAGVCIKCKDALHGALSLFLSLPGPRKMLEIRPRADGDDAMTGGEVGG